MADRSYRILAGTSGNGTPPASIYSSSRRPEERSRSPPKKSNLIHPQQYSSQRSAGEAAPPPPPAHATIALSSHPPHFLSSSEPPQSTSDVSSYNPQDSGFRALQGVDNLYNPPIPTPSPERTSPRRIYRPYSPQRRPDRQSHQSDNFKAPLMANRADHGVYSSPAHGMSQPYATPAGQSRHSYFGDGYDDIDPRGIADDGDDGLDYQPQRRQSRFGSGSFAAGAGAATGLFKGGTGSRNSSGQYGPISASQHKPEKSEWLAEQSGGSRRLKRTLWIGAIILILAIIAGAIAGGVIASKSKSGSSSSSQPSAASHNGGIYDINSAEVQKLMNNNDLHKVFPAMDYTPLNAQYPACLSNMPDQNNVTLDVALLSQLTPSIRLYGTDCNQTELVLEAMKLLKLEDSMTVWLGVWLGTNTTTNDRQMKQMYDLLDKYPHSQFAGVIIGNEVLFRKDMTLTQLGKTLTQVRSNFTSKSIKLPVATSDLGDNWTADLAKVSDIVMANVHPFFAGVVPDQAPGWTYNFWQQHDSSLAVASTGSWPKSIISEIGWPSEGGNDCGTDATSCSSGQGAIASIDNMNKFMDGFVCQSMANSTTYFWFEAFDEPWKVIFDTDSEKWESKWGLIDSDRNLKAGLKIPDCSGKTLTKPY